MTCGSATWLCPTHACSSTSFPDNLRQWVAILTHRNVAQTSSSTALRGARQRAARATGSAVDPRRLRQATTRLARILRDDEELDAEPWSPAAVSDLMLLYAEERMADKGKAENGTVEAATVSGEVSAVAAGSRRAGVPVPAYCGTMVKDFLEARGLRDIKDVSHAHPIHVSVLLRLEPQPAGSKGWWAWAMLLLIAFFCLRTGIIHKLSCRNFLHLSGDRWLLLWRLATKTSKGDVWRKHRPLQRFRVSAAEHRGITKVMSRAGVASFGSLTTAQRMSDFVRNNIKGAPKAFDIRQYGVRVAADQDALELCMPTADQNRLFWWAPAKPDMKLYYGGNNVLRMFAFSRERATIRYQYILPGTYIAVKPRAIDWEGVTTGETLHLPACPAVTEIDAVWDAAGIQA
jgi:hypothetical protein